MADVELLPGVYEVEWKNKNTRKKCRRYRVKITRIKQNFKFDRLYDTPEEANAIAQLAQTPEGRQHLMDQEEQAEALKAPDAKTLLEQAQAEAAQAPNPPTTELLMKQVFDTIRNPTFGRLLDVHFQNTIDVLPPTAPEHKQVQVKTYQSLIRTIKETKIAYRDDPRLKPGANFIKTWGKKRFGDFYLQEISEVEITEYIQTRLKTPVRGQKAIDQKGNIKPEYLNPDGSVRIDENHNLIDQHGNAVPVRYVGKASVKREISFISGFFSNLRYENKHEAEKLAYNPVSKAKLKLLNGHGVRRYRRLEREEEEILLQTLKESRNQDMFYIIAIALMTGMRRSEILSLTRSQVRANHIYLGTTKNGRERRVLLTKQAQELMQAILAKKNDERLFDYTINGFNANWKRLRDKAGIKDFRQHDCRREFISKVLDTITSSVVASEIVGIAGAEYFERAYMQPFREQKLLERGAIETEEELMVSVGHGSKDMTKTYTTIKKI